LLKKGCNKKTIASSGERLVGVQYLRGIAAALVVIDHAEGMARIDKYFGTLAWNGVLTKGAIGVDLFFVISGFIIVYVALEKNTIIPRIDIIRFLKKRAVRILPFMWLCIIGYATLRYMGRGLFEPLPYLRAMVLWPVGDIAPNLIWTLRHEMLFYVVFGVSVLIPWRPMKWFLFVYFLSPLLYWEGGAYLAGVTNLWGDFFFSRTHLLFGCGYLLGICYLKFPQLRELKLFPHWIIVVVPTPLLLVYANIFGDLLGTTLQVLFTGSLGLLIVFCSLTMNARSPLLVFEQLGNASYAIYLTHTAFLSAVLGLTHIITPEINVKIVHAMAVIIAILAGCIVHFLIERPLLSKLSRWK
jgi:exopolysaccharide production protein ExoZ